MERNAQYFVLIKIFLQPIERETKVFKPLVIPRKLQEALPYKYKPKFGVKASDKKKQVDRVAVIKEPREQKVLKGNDLFIKLIIGFFFYFRYPI